MKRQNLTRLSHRLADSGLTPRTKAARAALTALLLELVILGVQEVFLLAGKTSVARGLSGWITFLTIVNLALLGFLGVRWTRRVLMWRLRNRLFITYIFIGVFPVVLVAAMASLAGYLLAAQFAIFLATSDFHNKTDELQQANSSIAAQLAMDIRQGRAPAIATSPPDARFPQLEVSAFFRQKPLIVAGATPAGAAPAPAWLQGRFAGVVADGERNFSLRVVSTTPVKGEPLMVVTSLPVNEQTLSIIGKSLGQITLLQDDLAWRVEPARSKDAGGRSGEVAEPDREQTQFPVGTRTSITGGTVPAAVQALDRQVQFASPFPIVNWQSGASRDLLMIVRTRLSVLYPRLFLTSTQLGDWIRYTLVGIAGAFALIELFALIIGLRITRTITRSVAALYSATQRINAGDFRHRIQVRSHDQLAALEGSFNSMTGSLEELIAEQKEKQRLESDLAIAQEVQRQLFPHRGIQLPSLEVHGVCRPARTVSGDYYDFILLGEEKMCMAVGDISGKGISAALLMATVHSAVRVYQAGATLESTTVAMMAGQSGGRFSPGASMTGPGRNGGIQSPGEVLWLLNRHLLSSTPAEKYATLFLSIFDAKSRRLTYSNAGHLPPVLLGEDGELRRLDAGGTVVGLLDNMFYEEKSVELRKGDLFMAYSDGITEPENEFGEFGEDRLLDLVRENRRLPLARLSELVISAVEEWNGGAEQPDDLTLVLARAE